MVPMKTQRLLPATVSVTTAAGEAFTAADSADLAWLIYKRFGRNWDHAHGAWRQLLLNTCSLESYKALALTSRLAR